MQTNPRRISDDETKTTTRADVREVNWEREGERASARNPSSHRSHRRRALTKRSRRVALFGRRAIRLAEEITSASHGEQIASPLGDRPQLALECIERTRTLGAIELSCERIFPCTVRVRVSL